VIRSRSVDERRCAPWVGDAVSLSPPAGGLLTRWSIRAHGFTQVTLDSRPSRIKLAHRPELPATDGSSRTYGLSLPVSFVRR
jgi:hypothetical protein